MGNLKGRNLISITDFSREEYLQVLDIAEEFEKNPKQPILRDKVVATLFFEPSTRTRLSFESAANQLGARIIGFSDPGGTSVQKGESLHDTIVMVASYADLIDAQSQRGQQPLRQRSQRSPGHQCRRRCQPASHPVYA